MIKFLMEKIRMRWLISGILIPLILAAVFAVGGGFNDSDRQETDTGGAPSQNQSFAIQGTSVLFQFMPDVKYEVELYDILARRLDGIIMEGESESLASLKWKTLANLPEGVYYLTIKPEGKRRLVRKFVRLKEKEPNPDGR
jgi:hypothetical protein